METAADIVLLCPGQGAQKIGMGLAWANASDAARATLDEADAVLADILPERLTTILGNGPESVLNQTNVSQPAIFACSVASWRGQFGEVVGGTGSGPRVVATAGLSLGEYTALHLAGVFDFATGLRLVAERGRLMQEAAEASSGGMVALIGADEAQAEAICDRAREGGILVPANYNAPGQIVLSGDQDACLRAAEVAGEMELRATALAVAGAFHSPHMQSAADRMVEVLDAAEMSLPILPVWSNVTGAAHDPGNLELLRQRLVEQIVTPVRWAQGCLALIETPSIGDFATLEWHELAPGTTLRGLMRRIDRSRKVISHDQPA